MIIATAGHVDHGKTLLVKALTGIDADRLPEEKKRGMTIDLGFAYLPIAGGGKIGFIDVPGHERFIHNMLCGLPGIDFVLFIVAADDGIMPQTREHLAILDLLGIARGAVAITKTDRVAPARVTEVTSDVAALLSTTSLEGTPILPVSAVAGTGIEALRQHLLQCANDQPARADHGNFRLAIDRSFNVVGAGLVVTGTIVSGSVSVGDQLKTLLTDKALRVRGLHAQNKPAQSAHAGQRCALNIVGADLKKEAVTRGDWIVGGDIPPPIRKIDAELQISSNEQTSFAHWTPVHLHLGTVDVLARVAVLESPSIAVGEKGLAQFVLDRPIGAWHGDRFIVRDQSAQRTIGGGRVIDIFPPARGRARPDRLAFLRAMQTENHAKALTSLLEMSPAGVDLTRFCLARNLSSDEAKQVYTQVAMRVIPSAESTFGLSPQNWGQLKSLALQRIADFHRRSPDVLGPSEDRVFSGAPIKLPRTASVAIVNELAREGAIVKQGATVRLPSHLPTFRPADASLWKKVAPVLDEIELRPPTVSEIAVAVREDPKRIESLLVRVARQGHLIRLSQNRFFRPAALRRLAEVASDLASESRDGVLTVRAFRDRTEIGRNVSVEVLEYFDRVKFTQRHGDARKLIRREHELLGGNGKASGV